MVEIVKSQVRLPKELCEKAKAIAFEQNISLNQLIVNALHDQIMKRAYSPTKVKEALDLIKYALEHT